MACERHDGYYTTCYGCSAGVCRGCGTWHDSMQGWWDCGDSHALVWVADFAREMREDRAHAAAQRAAREK